MIFDKLIFVILLSIFLFTLVVPILINSKGPKTILLLQICFSAIGIVFLLLADGENAAAAQFYAIAFGLTSTGFLILMSLIYEKKVE